MKEKRYNVKHMVNPEYFGHKSILMNKKINKKKMNNV